MLRRAMLFCLPLLAGCATAPRPERVAGTYQASNPDFNFRGEATLRSDFTYTLTWRTAAHITLPDGRLPTWSGTETGRWQPAGGGVRFTDGKSEAGLSGRDCRLWGRYRTAGDDLHPKAREDQAGWVWLKRIQPDAAAGP